jgi:hypothetical protein
MNRVGARDGVELTDDRIFTHRVRRLVAISAVALGVITWLAWRSDGPSWSIVLLAAGWVLMPTVLAISLRRPLARYALVIPASLVIVGLWGMVTTATGTELLGWSLVLAGILFGGTLGMVFWYRWVSIPRRFNDPFGPARIALVAVHIGLVLAGAAIVFSVT